MQRPTAREPHRWPTGLRVVEDLGSGRHAEALPHVGHVGNTHHGVAVPFEHGIYRFLVLLAAAFVDAARVDPHPSDALVSSYRAGAEDLVKLRYAVAAYGIPQFLGVVSNMVEGDLIVRPPMGEDGVALCSENILITVVELKRSGVETPHVGHLDLWN